VQGNQDRAEHLLRQEQMTNIGAGEWLVTRRGPGHPPGWPGGAGGAVAPRLDRARVLGELGVAQADLGGKDTSFLVSKQKYKDFQLRAEFWVDAEANSGIFIRCTDPQKITAVNAYEVNIFDKRPDPSYGTGAIVNVAKVSPMPRAGGQWNTFDITAKGSQFDVTLNGIRTVAGAQDSKNPEGPIALQYGGGVVKFRRVMIRPL